MLTNTERQQIVEEVNAGTYGIDEALDDIAAAQKGEEVRKALYAEALVLNREGHAGSTDMIARQQIANLQTSVNGQISTLRTEVGDDIDDLEEALNSGLATQNGRIAAQNATIANVVANYNVEYGSTELWASTGETGALAAGTTVTLSEDVSHFDYIDIYSFCGNSNVLDTVPVDAKLQSSQGYALRWVNLSDPGSGSYKAYVRIIETRLHIIGTTLTIDHQVTYRNGEEVNISGAEITQSNRSTYMGELGIMKVVGRKITANTEIEDVRIGADGTEYASAGQAVRAQIGDVADAIPAIDTTLSVSGASADAKAVGDALATKADADDVEELTTAIAGKADSSDVTALGTRVTAVEGDVSELVEQLYTDGDAVEIQKADAESFVANSPSGLIHVKSTTTPIITGTTNFIDLFELAQGVFTDSDSGVTIEITGNEVYVHGSPTKGFRFDFQHGVFFTDAFTNHASDFGDILSNVDFCQLVWYEKEGYTLPSNVYIAALKQDGTINGGGLNTHVKAVYPKVSNQYIAMYTNGAVSNLDIKFTLGMKFPSFPIEATAQTEYDTTVISDAGYYETKAFTWTLADNVYDVVKATSITAEDPLTEGHIYAWFGDSLSQLKELPNIVANLLNVTVYDCTFAGAPLTYGNPTKYQPTGFMSLCSQIVAGDFTPLSDALDAQEAAGTSVTEKRQHLATLEALDFSTVTDIVLLAGTNDFDNDYVNATNFVSGFSGALTTLLTEYPHLMVYVISPPWRGDKTEGTATIPTMEDLVELEKGVADDFSLPWYDLYHRSGINALTATVFLTNDLLHPSDAGDALLANKCAKFIQSN